MKILITGAAGFIGFHVTKYLIDLKLNVYGIDNLNSYYDVSLKLDRLKELGTDTQSEKFLRQEELKSNKYDNFIFHQIDITDENLINNLFEKENFDVVIHLAAQAGVRYSIERPKIYVQSNIVGFINILEACRHNNVKHLLYASSSSVYGNSDDVPFTEKQNVNRPVSLYAATKISNELMAHTYNHLYNLKTTGFRIFTVYGPWGRPDMGPFLFTKAILSEEPIKLFNNGDLKRDFTYIDDIVDGIVKVVLKDDNEIISRIFNIGNNSPVKLLDFINLLEIVCNKKAILELLPMQPGDVYQTYADISELKGYCGYEPKTKLSEGLKNFVEWYGRYYGK